MGAVFTSTRAARTRAQILGATRRLLEGRGYHGVGLGLVAAEAGVSRQSIYLHFGSKANLLLALVADVDAAEGLPELGASVADAPTGADALDRFVDLVAILTERVHATAAALDAARRDHPDADAAWRDRMVSRRRTCERIVSRLADEGALASRWTVADAADYLWAMSSLRVWEDLVLERGWSTARFRRHLRAVLRSSLLGPA